MSLPAQNRSRMAGLPGPFPTLVPTPTLPAHPSQVQQGPVARARFRKRHAMLVISFLGLVLGQIMLAGWYLYERAADQYSSTFGFVIHSEADLSGGDLMARVPGLSALSGGASSDTDILYEYLQSQALVARIDEELNLRARWSVPEYDPVFAFDPDGTIEDLTRFWARMVHVSYDAGAGIMAIEVRAFDRDSARLIAEAIEIACGQLINRLSGIARQDRLSHARQELDRAETRLSRARQALTRFRVRHNIVDPMADLEGEMGVITQLRQTLAEEMVTLDMLRATTGQTSERNRRGEITDARITQSLRRIDVIETRIASERAKLGGQTGDHDYASLLGEFERLRVDVEVAQEAYVVALAAFEMTRAETNRQSRYLASYSAPTQPERSLFPNRPVLLAMIGAGLLLLWSILVMISYNVRDRT